ncbi:NUDIX domain-containing protein [Candidatus Woesearchaeota archaeon]|nr:NUDIX domain-containing protein [Candidatus Woesearchaeota archaeon]
MDDDYVQTLLARFKDLPRFSDGRIDFHTSKEAPVINCFVIHKEEFLLLKRSEQVSSYPGHWNFMSGYLDAPVSVESKILEELEEELGCTKDAVASIGFGEPFDVVDNDINRTWIVHPAFVELRERIIPKLNWEHTDYQWVTPDQFPQFKKIEGFEETYATIKKLLPHQ